MLPWPPKGVPVARIKEVFVLREMQGYSELIELAAGLNYEQGRQQIRRGAYRELQRLCSNQEISRLARENPKSFVKLL